MLGEVVERLRGASGPDRNGWYTALCPFHKDEHRPNLRFRQTGFCCMACGEKGGLKKLAAKLGIYAGPLTLAEYAAAKQLAEKFLREVGLTDGRTGLRIPYMDERGDEIAVRLRHSLTGDRRFSWRRGSHPVPYGLWKLSKAKERGFILLVEGESNCHTLWLHDFPALGIPGAATWKPAWSSYLGTVPKVFLIQDPDDAGKSLAQRMAADLPDRLLIVRLEGVKDVSDLHLAEPDAFPKRLREALDKAQAYNATVNLDPQLAQDGLDLLRDPALFDRIRKDLEIMGLVGEPCASLLLYLVATSRKMSRPLGAAARSPSSYGKTMVVSRVRELMPEDEVVEASRLTPQAIHYWEKSGLRGKWLVIQDIATSQDMGSARILFSDGGLRVFYPAKDDAGNLITTVHSVEGPVAYTDIAVTPLTDVQDSSRFLEIPMDGSQAQTERIQDRQRWEFTLEGLRRRPHREAVIRHHRAAQCLLRSGLEVVIPFAPFVKFPSTSPRSRRDLARFLNLVQAVAFLRQFQKAAYEEDAVHYIEADLEDYRTAYELFLPLASAVLNDLNSHSLSVLEGISSHYQSGDTFTRQELAGTLNLRLTFVRDYIGPLVEGGFVEVVEEGGRGKSWVYKVARRVPGAVAISTPEEVAEAVRLTEKLVGGDEPSAVNSSKSGSQIGRQS